jgi:hypothetical protein
VSVTRVLAGGRAAAERLMTDTCTITRPGARTWDAASGTYTQATTTVYSGPCRVRVLTPGDRTDQAGEEQVTTWRYLVSIPVTGSVELDDEVTVNTSADSTLVGRVLRVRQVTRGSQITARRMVCEEREAP